MKFIRPPTENATHIQCVLYARLVEHGVIVYAEYKIGNCRFDLIVIEAGEIVAIIETKKDTKKFKLGKQFKKYSSYGLPLIYCRGLKDIDQTVEQVLTILERIHYRPISEYQLPTA